MQQQHPTLLTVPYDIRHLIYQHLFPSTKLIYIQARAKKNRLTVIPTSTSRSSSSSASIPTALLRVSRHLHAETSAYLYTTYIFHILGAKEDCLGCYPTLEKVLSKVARQMDTDGDVGVYVHALSNGTHSRTGAILLHIGRGKLESVRRRGRGVEVSLEGLRREVGEGSGGLLGKLDGHWKDKFWWLGMGGFVAVLVGTAAWVFSVLNIVSR